MELYSLGKVPWQESQLIFHALARLGREALSLVSPATPYVSIGFHQDVEQEVDLAYCEKEGIPVFRREVGGGAVYLDGDQLFFHLILHKDNPIAPKNKKAFYRKFLQPVIETYRRIGIPAEYKPVNDVICGTRKISGTGVGEIGDCIVFVGNLIVDFNYAMMARVLKVPDEKFRDKIHKTLEDNLSTIRRELGLEAARKWDEDTLNRMMADEFAKLVGSMESRERDPQLIREMERLGKRMMTAEWLHRRGRRAPGREVKIRAGVEVVHRMHKAAGGLVRADFMLDEGRLRDLHLSGDFFCFPPEGAGWIEEALEGCSAGAVEQTLQDLWTRLPIETPGVELSDWLAVLA